jgi:CubicO group peptidase (beta-lactamase class C family)
MCVGAVFPGAAWEFKKPAEVGLDEAKLDALRDYLGGQGCVVRSGYMVYTWGDQSKRTDIASAAKPVYTHFLMKALEDGKIASLDEKAAKWEPRLNDLNADLGHKDRNIAWRHLANQTSCYGVPEAPGTAFDYNDWQMALFWDTLFLKVYRAENETVDAKVLHPLLTDILHCQDNPTFMVFGTAGKRGRVGISVRDFARFGLLYLRKGNWNGRQLISAEHARMVTSSPLPASLPRTTASKAAEMIPGQRSHGSLKVPDNQTDHLGSYSWCWWTNGVDRDRNRHWPDAPLDTFGAFGHANGQRAVVVIPSLDLVISWNDTKLEEKPGNPVDEALRLLVGAVTRR